METKIVSLPVGGMDWKQWTDKDVAAWLMILRRGKVTTQREAATVSRLKKKYQLHRYYKFEHQLKN